MEILLVEDNEADAFLMQEVLQEGRQRCNITVASNGVEAMEYLHRTGAYAREKAPRPDLVLLDLNMPKKDGREVLAEMKDDPSLRSIPVIVLTTSESEEDIRKSYDSHANCYIVKPLGLDQMNEAVQAIHDFWFRIVTLPPPRE